jgi:hypothetical protein
VLEQDFANVYAGDTFGGSTDRAVPARLGYTGTTGAGTTGAGEGSAGAHAHPNSLGIHHD